MSLTRCPFEFFVERRGIAVERRLQLGGRSGHGVRHYRSTIVQLREAGKTDHAGRVRLARHPGGQQGRHGSPQTSQHGRRYGRPYTP